VEVFGVGRLANGRLAMEANGKLDGSYNKCLWPECLIEATKCLWPECLVEAAAKH